MLLTKAINKVFKITITMFIILTVFTIINTTTEKTIKEINGVFKQFLNILYQSDMNDTNVEIKVLNSMLKADGLSKNELKVEGKNDE